MPPAVTVLQLDTGFPRVPGDVGCVATYCDDIEVLRIPNATVGHVVSARPDLIDIAPFEDALDRARGDIIVTSCGFLSFWQDHLAARASRPFISSALTALGGLSQRYDPHEVLTLTFDASSLSAQHFGAYPAFLGQVVGLPRDMHLRRVISENQTTLDVARAEAELVALVSAHIAPRHKHLLFECTNLPPYAPAIRMATGLPITDILTLIEAMRPGSIQPRFLGAASVAHGSPQNKVN